MEKMEERQPLKEIIAGKFVKLMTVCMERAHPVPNRRNKSTFMPRYTV